MHRQSHYLGARVCTKISPVIRSRDKARVASATSCEGSKVSCHRWVHQELLLVLLVARQAVQNFQASGLLPPIRIHVSRPCVTTPTVVCPERLSSRTGTGDGL